MNQDNKLEGGGRLIVKSLPGFIETPNGVIFDQAVLAAAERQGLRVRGAKVEETKAEK